jgi:hypothetical protein
VVAQVFADYGLISVHWYSLAPVWHGTSFVEDFPGEKKRRSKVVAQKRLKEINDRLTRTIAIALLIG